MSKAFIYPIKIQKRNDQEKWEDLYILYSRILKNKDLEYQSAGALQSKSEKIFEVRYHKNLENIEYNKALYRIVYNNTLFSIKNYEDYLENHKTIKLTGLSYE